MKPLKRIATKNHLINTRLKSGANEKRRRQQTVSNGFATRALLICNGEPPSKKLARQLAGNVDLIVAADGGANVARKLGIHPDIIIGDLDSITEETKRHFSKNVLPRASARGQESESRVGFSQTRSSIWLKPNKLSLSPIHDLKVVAISDAKRQLKHQTQFIRVTRQDNTDLEKALDFLVEQKINRATIIGATGKRLDHTLGNLSVIWNYAQRIKIEIVDDGFVAIPIMKKKTIAAKKGTTVSLVPFGACSGVTLKGLYYPLTNATMKVGEIGVSNVVSKSPFTVEVKRGKMLMIVLADHSAVQV